LPLAIAIVSLLVPIPITTTPLPSEIATVHHYTVDDQKPLEMYGKWLQYAATIQPTRTTQKVNGGPGLPPHASKRSPSVVQAKSNPTYFYTGGNSFLSCVKQRESGGNYTVVNSVGAAGAYQFLTSTWQNAAREIGITQYATANAAPPNIQDQVAQHVLATQGQAPWACTKQSGCHHPC
jgi:hypothetical protein